MKEGVVTLNRKEQKRLMVLNQMNAGQCKGEEAASLLGLSLRQVRRLAASYRKEGASALAHGNRGRTPPNAIGAALRQQIVELFQGKYAGFNTQHFTESLSRREGINLSRSTIRNVLLGTGIASPKTRRSPQHRSRRERYPQEGMLVQIDASPHDWLEGRGPSLTLIGAIDDATGKVLMAFFREQEDSAGYFQLLRGIVERDGIPLALYHDRHTIFDSPKGGKESLAEQLEGKQQLTQFGRLLAELGITSISAQSPQAKGRIERLWGTFQDRLVSEMRLAQAQNLSEANKVLEAYLPQFNQAFQVKPREEGLAYRKMGKGMNLDQYFCFKHQRVVGGDNVVRFKGTRLQIMPTRGRISYAHARVEVHVKLDGSLGVYYQGQYLLTRPAPLEASLCREVREAQDAVVPPKPNPVRRHKPAPDHPWRRPLILSANSPGDKFP